MQRRASAHSVHSSWSTLSSIFPLLPYRTGTAKLSGHVLASNGDKMKKVIYLFLFISVYFDHCSSSSDRPYATGWKTKVGLHTFMTMLHTAIALMCAHVQLLSATFNCNTDAIGLPIYRFPKIYYNVIFYHNYTRLLLCIFKRQWKHSWLYKSQWSHAWTY